jgi:hypothetical protein
MSRVVEEAKSPKVKKSGQNGKKNSQKRFISFHPTKEEKEHIRTMDESLDDSLVGIRPWLAEGHKITLGFSANNEACYASIRESHDDWTRARALSAWHADPDVALRSLCYALVSRFPTFPEIGTGEGDYDLDW